tara:strand:+ start:2309 stop:2524 length:216 start_codon:yes stop_codon:yes gene_type:complete
MSEIAPHVELVCDTLGGGANGAASLTGGSVGQTGIPPLKIRDMTSDHVQKLVMVTGICTQVRPRHIGPHYL